MITRSVCCSTYNAQAEPLFEQLNLLKVNCIFGLNTVKLFYKHKQNCPLIKITYRFQNFSREYDHHIRQRLVLNNVFLSSRYGEKCIRFYVYAYLKT